MTLEDYHSGIDAQLHWIAEARDVLCQKARAVVDGYWAHHYKTNGKLDVWDRSVLGVRVKRLEEGDFYIQWFWNKWYKDKKDKKHPLSQHIRKGKGFSYSDAALRKHAKTWEADLVLSLEREFAEIRKQVRELKLAEQALRRLRVIIREGESSGSADAQADEKVV